MNNTANWLKELSTLMRKHREYIGIATAVFILLIFPPVIRLYDPVAAPIDAGALSAILMAVVAVLIFLSATWFFVRTIWPVFADYSENAFQTDFKQLASWQKIKVYLSFYLFVAGLFAAALASIL